MEAILLSFFFGSRGRWSIASLSERVVRIYGRIFVYLRVDLLKVETTYSPINNWDNSFFSLATFKSCFSKNGTFVKLSEPPTLLRLSLVAFCSSVYYCHTSVANWCVFAIKILSGSKPDKKAFLWWHFSITLRSSSRHDFDFYTSMDY